MEGRVSTPRIYLKTKARVPVAAIWTEGSFSLLHRTLCSRAHCPSEPDAPVSIPRLRSPQMLYQNRKFSSLTCVASFVLTASHISSGMYRYYHLNEKRLRLSKLNWQLVCSKHSTLGFLCDAPSTALLRPAFLTHIAYSLRQHPIQCLQLKTLIAICVLIDGLC